MESRQLIWWYIFKNNRLNCLKKMSVIIHLQKLDFFFFHIFQQFVRRHFAEKLVYVTSAKSGKRKRISKIGLKHLKVFVEFNKTSSLTHFRPKWYMSQDSTQQMICSVLDSELVGIHELDSELFVQSSVLVGLIKYCLAMHNIDFQSNFKYRTK